MEQRRYRSAVEPEALAHYLEDHLDEQRRTEAQVLGQGDSVVVQVKHGREGREQDSATIGIHRDPDQPGVLVVTQGEQQWLTKANVDHVAGTMIGALWTPWALFGLLWPARNALSNLASPGEIWHLVDTFVLTQGGELIASEDLEHPHAAPS